MKPFSKIRELNELVDSVFQRALELGLNDASLAAKAGLCERTVANLGAEVTQFPRLQTVWALAKAVGFELRLARIVAAKQRKAG